MSAKRQPEKDSHDEHMFSARATLTDMCPGALAGKVIVSAFPKPGSERRPQAATARPSGTGLRLDSEFEIEPIGGARLGRSKSAFTAAQMRQAEAASRVRSAAGHRARSSPWEIPTPCNALV
jgi:hypothetical protein